MDPTVSHHLLETLGVRLIDGEALTDDQKRTLEPLLASRAFSLHSTIHVTRLPGDEGFLLTQ